MDIGIGLPATIPDVEGHVVIEWARRADAAGFTSVGVIDRIVYPNYELLLGGSVQATFDRIARHGDGWIMGGGTPDQFADGAKAVDAAWTAAGREGRPRNLALVYFALGPDGQAAADSYLHHYYGFLGD